MSYVVFENDGEIDIRSVKTFGVSVKDSANPIGYFGTGLKYAIAILLRDRHEVIIQSGISEYVFRLKDTDVRGKNFSLVCMNDEELSFTTELGKNWQMWQAFREIYCNCLDEGGVSGLVCDMPAPTPGKTRVIVRGQEFLKTYEQRDQIVLAVDPNLLLHTGDVEIFNKKNDYIYYRGIRVLRLNAPSLLTYNVTSEIELTEDRTVKHESSVTSKIPRMIAGMTNKRIIRNVLTAPQDAFEAFLNFEVLSWCGGATPEFKEVLEEAFKFNDDQLNSSAREYHQKIMNEKAAKHYEPVELNHVESMQLKKCKEICAKIFPHFIDYEIMVVKTLGRTTMALADRHSNTMVISRDCFGMGTKYLLSTLIEEYAHLKTGYRDHTRELQTWLFDQFCTLIENHVTGEAV